MNQKKLAAAYLMISKGYAALAEAHDASEDDDDETPVASSKTKAKAEVEGKKESNKGTSKESDDKEDSPSPKSGKAAAKALAELKGMDIDSVTRPELVPLAKALGVDVEGVVTNDLRATLKKLVKSKAEDSDDETEDEKPSSGKGKKPAADDDDEDSEPDIKTMKKQFRTFAKAHKKELEENIGPEYFDSEDDDAKPAERLHLTLADEKVLRKQWKDNVKELVEDPKAWAKIEKKAAAADDE